MIIPGMLFRWEICQNLLVLVLFAPGYGAVYMLKPCILQVTII